MTENQKHDRDLIVSDRVRMFMTRKGLTQVAVAHAAGMTQPGLSRTLSGERQWRVDEVVQLADTFQVPVAELVS